MRRDGRDGPVTVLGIGFDVPQSATCPPASRAADTAFGKLEQCTALPSGPTTFERKPHCVSMFHSALHLRLVLDEGRTPPPSGFGSVKPWTPCCAGRLPVAIEFHNIGERIGRVVARFPQAPVPMSDAVVGISPCSISG